MIASLLNSQKHFSVFWLILIMLLSGWSPLVFWFLNPPVPLPRLWGFFQAYLLQLISLLPSYYIVFFSSLARSKYLSLFLLPFIFTLYSVRTAKSTIRQILLYFVFFSSFSFFFFFFFFCLSLVLVVWPGLGDLFVVQNPRTDSDWCIYHLLVWSIFKFLYNSQWITSSSLSYPVFYSFCVNLHIIVIIILLPH